MSDNVLRLENHPSIVTASPIVLKTGLVPYRIVLREVPRNVGGEYIVHNERVNIRTEEVTRDGYKQTEVVCSHDSFDHGSYFEYGGHTDVTRSAAYQKAYAEFKERVEKRLI